MQEFEYLQKLMGTSFTISIIAKEAPHLLYADLLEMATEYEKEFSRFDPQSALSKLNKEKKLKASKRFFEVLKKAQEIYTSSNGVFNPLVQIKNMGYNKDFSEVKNFSKPENPKQSNLNFEDIAINERTGVIEISKNQELDFGGFLKGYLSDKIIEKTKKFPGAIVNIGGDIATQGLDKDMNKFKFTIFNPITEEENIIIELNNQGMATSGVYKRKWEIDGEKYTHIIDPKNVKGARSDLCSATIISDSACTADAFATTTFILGTQKGISFLKENNCHYVLIKNNGDIIVSEKITPQVTISA